MALMYYRADTHLFSDHSAGNPDGGEPESNGNMLADFAGEDAGGEEKRSWKKVIANTTAWPLRRSQSIPDMDRTGDHMHGSDRIRMMN